MLYGVLGAGKTLLLANGERLQPAVMFIDMSELNIDAQRVGGSAHNAGTRLAPTGEKLPETRSDCICRRLENGVSLDESARIDNKIEQVDRRRTRGRGAAGAAPAGQDLPASFPRWNTKEAAA